MEEKRARNLFVLSLVALIGFMLFCGVYGMLVPDYIFNKEVHSHFENAYFSNTPELMKSELELSVAGMKNLGLEEDMYDAYFYWDKVPAKKMDYQYNHVNSIIQRVDAVKQWRDENYAKGTGASESLGDVYEQKMDNLRGFLQEDGWSDWIAKGTYYANYYSWLYLSWIIDIILFVLAVIFGVVWFFEV